MANQNRRMSEQFGDLEYEYDLLDHLDPIARAGFDPNRVRVGDPTKKGQDTAYYQPVGDIINIGPSQLSSKGTHAHEFRERGINILLKEISEDSLAFRKKYGDELYFQLLDLKIAIEAQDRPQMIEDGEYNKNFAEMISEFYEKHESYNKPTGPYVEGEDVPPFSYNRKTRQPNTAAERLALLKAYADERGLPVRQGMRVITPEEQFRILETDNQSAFREYLQTNPADRVEGAFFRGAFRGDDTVKNRPLFESVDLLRQFAEEQNKKRGIRNPEEYFVVKPREQFAQGGPVMRGIGTLNETARNMTRGPRGIGAYQQFASGGEAMGPPPTRGPDPQGIGAFQQFADGGPVYMSNGGDPFAEVDFETLTEAVIQTESGGDPNAVSVDDAIGLMQILPSTAAQPGYENYGAENVFDIAIDMGFPVDEGERTVEKARQLLFDPEVNMAFGKKYLQAMISHSDGDIKAALQKYNAGTGNYQAFIEGRKPLDQEAVKYPITVAKFLRSLMSPEAQEERALRRRAYEEDYTTPEPAQSGIAELLPSFKRAERDMTVMASDQSVGEQLRQDFQPYFGSESQQDDFELLPPTPAPAIQQPSGLMEKYSAPNMAERLLGKKPRIKPNLRPPEVEFGEDKGGVFRSLRPQYRPEEEPARRYPGTNTNIGKGLGIYI